MRERLLLIALDVRFLRKMSVDAMDAEAEVGRGSRWVGAEAARSEAQREAEAREERNLEAGFSWEGFQ